MIFPEALYRPSAKDVQAFAAQMLAVKRDTSAAAALFTTNFHPNADLCFIVTNALAQAVPDAAQNVTARGLIIGTIPLGLTVNEANMTSILSVNAGAGALGGIVTQSITNMEVWVPPGMAIAMSATFNAGVNANRAIFSVTGIVIPRGQLQLPGEAG